MRPHIKGCRVPDGNESESRQSQPLADRLDSWKEIAAFLQRDVRTVQRWEKHAGLPVYRHAESRLRTAYAYRSELETWWRAQRSVVESEPSDPAAADVPTPAYPGADVDPGKWLRRWRILPLAGIALVAVVTAAALGLLLTRPSPPDGAPIPVVMTAFDDQVNDARLTGAIEEVVARDMAAAYGFEPLSTARLTPTLRLMRRDPRLPLTEPVAREVATREGHIRYVVSGRIHSLGGRYFADLKAVDPDGQERANVEWQAAAPDQLVSSARSAVRRFARALRHAAAGAAGSAGPLDPVTSSSTPAVRLYTAAVHAGLRRQWGASEFLATRALALDPEFASAHAWVGWAMRRQGRTAKESRPFLERAMALAGAVSDRENYLIAGMFHAVDGDLRAASASLEALLRLHANDRKGLDMLIEVLWRMGRVRRAVGLSVLRAEKYPDDFYANVRAAHALASGRGKPDRAAVFAERARQLAAADAFDDSPWWNAWLHVLPVFTQWVRGDATGAIDTLSALDRSLVDRLGRDRDAFASAVGFAHLAFGRTVQAEHAFRYGSAPERQMNLAVVALSEGDEAGARRWLSQVRDHSARRPALFARAGLEREALRGLEGLAPSDHTEGIVAVTRGLVALRRGQIEGATAALRQGLDLLRSSGEPAYFFAAEALAAIAEARGDVTRSIRLLTDAAGERNHTYAFSQWTAANWIRTNTDLVRHSRRAGRHEEAERISAGLRQILDAGAARGQEAGAAPAVR